VGTQTPPWCIFTFLTSWSHAPSQQTDSFASLPTLF
jgi:hypothetical protein